MVERNPLPRRRLALIGLIALGAVVVGACAPAAPSAPAPKGPALGPVERTQGVDTPVLPNVSDPSVVTFEGRYYVYASDHHFRAPVTVVDDIDAPIDGAGWFDATHDAMPVPPAWAASDRQHWAPTVAPLGDRWVMFFGTDRRNPPQPHNAQCIGRAFAEHPAGPFVADPVPWDCGIGGAGGALDPELHTDRSGQRWLLLTYSDTEAPIRSVRLDGAANAVGDVHTILDRRWSWEYWFIENPSMAHDPGRGDYVLTYSAGRWNEAAYSTGVARCSSPAGPCTSDPAGPWISSGRGRTGTGGFTFFTDLSGAQRGLLSSWREGVELQVPRAASVLDVSFSPALVAR
jgi:hypothetical protein